MTQRSIYISPSIPEALEIYPNCEGWASMLFLKQIKEGWKDGDRFTVTIFWASNSNKITKHKIREFIVSLKIEVVEEGIGEAALALNSIVRDSSGTLIHTPRSLLSLKQKLIKKEKLRFELDKIVYRADLSTFAYTIDLDDISLEITNLRGK